METKNDGGAAFPRPLANGQMDGKLYVDEGATGMSLRDYFAGKAMNGILSDPNVRIGGDKEADEIAQASFLIADAMIRARGGE